MLPEWRQRGGLIEYFQPSNLELASGWDEISFLPCRTSASFPMTMSLWRHLKYVVSPWLKFGCTELALYLPLFQADHSLVLEMLDWYMTNSFIYSYNLPTVFLKLPGSFFLLSWKCPKADPLCCQILLRVSSGLFIDSPPAHNVPTELIPICENLEPVRIFFMPALIPFNGLPPTSSWSLKAMSVQFAIIYTSTQ